MDEEIERYKKQNTNLIARCEWLELALRRLRDGVDAPDIHCEPLPASSSWLYIVERAIGKTVG